MSDEITAAERAYVEGTIDSLADRPGMAFEVPAGFIRSTVGPAPVDDPAPYIGTRIQVSDPAYKISRIPEDSERRLTIAAQLMAAEIQREDPDSDLQPFTELAERAFEAADTLIARWKETT